MIGDSKSSRESEIDSNDILASRRSDIGDTFGNVVGGSLIIDKFKVEFVC